MDRLRGAPEALGVERLRTFAQRHPILQHAAVAVCRAALGGQCADLVGHEIAYGVRAADRCGGYRRLREDGDGRLRRESVSEEEVECSAGSLERSAVARLDVAQVEE